MPSLVRFLLIIGLIAAIAFAAMFALATFVTVTPRPMEQIVPPARLNK
ncbi:histidine kinase [Hyphomicrobiales bacterium BP6-180914]|uniref:Histidine kinase n=1 Tax=Lichenifustis flavocetrariae TaxID=2949735 RepID=A0AA42CL78_9HYPH|nr:histidine kinase [Lichenifustis flavocetrariae]MCW6507025.1 histidine kinase [Lichenifustis flavocetrariae]